MSILRGRISLILFLSLLFLPFNNCSQTDNRLFLADQGSGSQNGGLQINIQGPSQLQIPADYQIFTVSGACNSGVYSDTDIYWQILKNGQVIVDSVQAGGSPFFSTCINNSYVLDVRVPCPGIVNTPNGCFGLTQSYTLQVRIIGLNASGFPADGANVRSNPITLVP